MCGSHQLNCVLGAQLLLVHVGMAFGACIHCMHAIVLCVLCVRHDSCWSRSVLPGLLQLCGARLLTPPADRALTHGLVVINDGALPAAGSRHAVVTAISY
jgi:hypothetical protein